MNAFRPSLALIPLFVAFLLVGGFALRAQLDGADRGIPPIDSTSNFEILGIDVDVTGKTAEEARLQGWRQAQSQGWKMLWSRTNDRPIGEAPDLSDSVLNSIVAGIVIEQEQIGPRRYVARLGVLFDRARTGGMLGVPGLARRSAPLLVIPILRTGSTGYAFEFRNEWQRAWAHFRTANSPIDYVRTSGTGIDPLLLNMSQAGRRGRGWWRMILDQYGAADLVIPEVELRRAFPGGPAIGIFTARFGPDSRPIGRFRLQVPNSAGIPQMMDEGVRRLDALYVRALEAGILAADPSLVIVEPALPPIEEEESAEELAPVETPPPLQSGPATAFNILVETPDAAAVQRAELAASRVNGVTSAITTSLALGGTSIMRVTYVGDVSALAAALQSQGYRVEVTGGNSLRMSR